MARAKNEIKMLVIDSRANPIRSYSVQIIVLSKCYINVKTFVCFRMQNDVVFNNNNELLIFGL